MDYLRSHSAHLHLTLTTMLAILCSTKLSCRALTGLLAEPLTKLCYWLVADYFLIEPFVVKVCRPDTGMCLGSMPCGRSLQLPRARLDGDQAKLAWILCKSRRQRKRSGDSSGI
eukprot:6198177-Amphidinium_carterae.1